MHDVKWLREDPAAFDAALARRGVAPCAQELLALDKEWRALETRVQTLEADLLAHTPDRIELEDRIHAGAHAAEDLTATTDPDHRGDTDVDVVDVADLTVAAMHFASTGSIAIEILDPIQGAAPAPASKESVAAEEDVESST